MKKVCLIVGASSDIGIALLKSLAAKEPDTKFYCHYRTTFAISLPNIVPIQADLAEKDGVFKLIGGVSETPTHIIFLPANRFEYIRFKDVKREALETSLEISVYSLCEIFKMFLPKMVKNKYGRIAVMLSTSVRNLPPKFLTEYVVSKYALLGLFKAAAAEYEGKGIFINGISPEMTQTKFIAEIDERIIATVVNNSRFGRLLTPEEVAAGIEYLLSDNTVMTGENLFIG